MSDSTAEAASEDGRLSDGDPIYWGALGLFGVTALVDSAFDLAASGPGLSVVARLLSGALLVGLVAWATVRPDSLVTPDSTLIRALVVGGAFFYAAVTLGSLV